MLEVSVKREKITTYPEAKAEELPMFAENRVHQRTSGDPFPNKVVVEAQRKVRIEKEYTVIYLSNEYIELAVLPELGGKIWYAKDKKNAYEFIYKNNVVKPALIGVLGSWTSGGMEFNWPFHHRASTFMPVDYTVERGEDYATIWISEHDPIDRMKGMVGITLKKGECTFETKVKLDNTTDVRKSFLWWENTAVPVNKQYEIFFPEDVNYVRFHYKRSVTTFPIANNDRFGAFNGIYYDGNTDISKHKNTLHATSYFSADSVYDYFGGYDHGKNGGIVHIAEHRISPGKKMFTWAYCQLAKTWENALTDTDGQYAELMAGCYSDNQPDLSWLAPNETKVITQRWYPIHGAGTPTFANENFALFNSGKLKLQAVREYNRALLQIERNGKAEEKKVTIPCYAITEIGEKLEAGDKISITSDNGETLLCYEYGKTYDREIPAPRKEYPYFKEIKSAQELYKLGLHAEQYRSPEYRAETCYEEALKRDDKHTPSMIALAEIYYKKFMFDEALETINRAEKIACEYNTRLESGRLYYTKGLILSAIGEEDPAYDYYYKAYFANDYKNAALLKIFLADIRRKDYKAARAHVEECLSGNSYSCIANAYAAYLYALQGDRTKALQELESAIEKDKLNLYALSFKAILTEDYETYVNAITTDISQNLADICGRLYESGLREEMKKLLSGVRKYRVLAAMPLYVSDFAEGCISKEYSAEGIAFPSRIYESKILETVCAKNAYDFSARYYLGVLYYGRGNYEKGLEYFKQADALRADYRVKRCLAVAYYSHFKNIEYAKKYMSEAIALAPYDEKQMTFEYAYFLAKTGADGEEIAKFINSRNTDRDELAVELARAYNHMDEPDKALKVLLERKFVACEGGEHYIADQYMYAYYLKGKKAYEKGDYRVAIDELNHALTLPQSLGAGLWNDIKKTPYLYFIAKCYDKLGEREKVLENLKQFDFYKFDYFTNMYLYTYRYYLAKAYLYQGKKAEADKLIADGIAADLSDIGKESMGYFGTTPFFISYIDDNKTARETYYSYRLYLYYSYSGDKANAEKYKTVFGKDKYGMYIEDFT